MHNTLRQSETSREQVTAAPSTTTQTAEKWDCFEADLYDLQLDAPPSWPLRSRIAYHLNEVVSYQRVMRASRSRLLHWMLAQEAQSQFTEDIQ